MGHTYAHIVANLNWTWDFTTPCREKELINSNTCLIYIVKCWIEMNNYILHIEPFECAFKLNDCAKNVIDLIHAGSVFPKFGLNIP